MRDRLRSKVRSVIHHGIGADLGAGAIYQVVGVLTSGLTFVVLGRELGPSGFGYYVAIQNLVLAVGLFASGGAPSVLLQRVIREGRAPDEVVGSLLSWTAIGAVSLLGVATLLAWSLVPGLSVVVSLEFSLSQLLGTALAWLGVALVQATEGFSRANPWRLAVQLPPAAVLIGLWVTADVSLASLALWWLLVNLASGLVCLVTASRRARVQLSLGAPRLLDLRLGLTYAAVGLCFNVEEDADKVLLVRLGRPAVAGTYAAAYRVVQLGLIPLNTVVSATHNLFLEHDDKATGQHLSRALIFTLPALAYGGVCAVALWFAAPVVPVVLGPAYRGAVDMIRWLAALVALRSASAFPFNALMGIGMTGSRLWILGASAVSNLTLNFLLIPEISWRGAVIATFAGEASYVALSWVMLVRAQLRHDQVVRSDRGPEATPG